MLRETRRTGYDADSTLNNDITEFYFLYRFLKFEKLKRKILQFILKGINDGLHKVYSSKSTAPEIVMNNQREEEIKDAEKQFFDGDIKFNDFLKVFR
jgi:hypothetical protein